MPSTSYTLARGDDEFPLEIDYEVAAFDPGNVSGPPESCYPPEGGEVESLTAFFESREFKLTDDECERVEQHIYATHDYYG